MTDWSRPLEEFLSSLPGHMKTEIATVVAQQANRLADAQRAKLAGLEKPPEETGGLLKSVRVERKNDLLYFVLAGGPASTKNGYDHALAFEFGTRRQPPRPFFYSTARQLNASMREAIENAAGAAVGRNFE